MLISVVICTYNRADLLASALESVCAQTLDASAYEIVVVDNNSTDGTVAIVRPFCSGSPTVRYCVEFQQGLSYARNRGWMEARGEYVAFMDDDAQASRNWLETAARCFTEVRPALLGIGGKILPHYTDPKPKWFKDEYEVRSWGEEPRFLIKGESFSGSNMIFRKKTLERFGGFDVAVGVKGPYLSVGEETGLFERIWQTEETARLFYLPQLVVFHAVPAYKMTVSYYLKRAFVTGQASQVRNRPQSLHGRLWSIARISASLACYFGQALLPVRKLLAWRNWILENCLQIAAETGRLAASVGLFFSVRQRGP